MRKPASRVGVGASSIMLIIVVVCVTLFSVLALISARNDRTLSEKTCASVSAYYEADARAQQVLSSVDRVLLAGDEAGLDGLGLTDLGGGRRVFTVETDEGHALTVELTVEDGGYLVTSYCYQATGEWTDGDAPGVWGGLGE